MSHRLRLVWAWALLWPLGVQADTMVDRMLARYEQIQSVTCDVRRDISNQDGRMRWLSRVHYERPDKLHVENHSPLPRRIISDGTHMYQYNDGQPRGFRKPVEELNETMLHGLRKVPGTVMEHLFRMQGVEEIALEDGEGAYPIRRAYQAERVYAVLHLDAAIRLGRIELFDGEDHSKLTGKIDFDAFEEVLEGVWIPMLHRGRFTVGELENRETTRISNYTVNKSIPRHLFNADGFFKDVQWVDQFEDL